MNAALLMSAALLAAPPTTVPAGEEPLVDIQTINPRFLLDIRYATPDNFAKVAAYPVARCVVRKSVAERMGEAQAWLDERHPGTVLMFKDCYRPDRVQRILYRAVRGTKMAAYVANPDTSTGSIHSYGAAVDLTLAREGKELAMGTAYDHLGKLAEPRHEARFLKQGKLTKLHIANREILRGAMKHARMRGLRNEWWHFNAGTSRQVRRRYTRLDVPLADVPRPKPAPKAP